MFLFNELIELWRSDNSLTQALNDSHAMLESTNQMFQESVRSLRQSNAGEIGMNIYEKDQAVNRYEQQVRRKVLKHLAITGGVNIIPGLILTSIVIDIERIGDYTKNIVELASAVEGPFDGLELHDEVLSIEGMLGKMFSDIVPALEESDETRARAIISSHGVIAEKVDKHIHSLTLGEALVGRSGHAATVALYLRFLKRVSAHIKNVATSVVNPYYRFGFREKEAGQ